jgi:hypothetical protein
MKLPYNIKPKVIIWAVAILIVVIIAWVLISRSRKTISMIPDDNQPSINDPLSDTEKTEVKRLATALYNELNGTRWDFLWNRDPIPFNDLAIASDRITVGTYNYFNDNFGNGKTLWQWIYGDWYKQGTAADHSVNLIKEKFTRLGLI